MSPASEAKCDDLRTRNAMTSWDNWKRRRRKALDDFDAKHNPALAERRIQREEHATKIVRLEAEDAVISARRREIKARFNVEAVALMSHFAGIEELREAYRDHQLSPID